jgi:hypothetical protein
VCVLYAIRPLVYSPREFRFVRVTVPKEAFVSRNEQQRSATARPAHTEDTRTQRSTHTTQAGSKGHAGWSACSLRSVCCLSVLGFVAIGRVAWLVSGAAVSGLSEDRRRERSNEEDTTGNPGLIRVLCLTLRATRTVLSPRLCPRVGVCAAPVHCLPPLVPWPLRTPRPPVGD